MLTGQTDYIGYVLQRLVVGLNHPVCISYNLAMHASITNVIESVRGLRTSTAKLIAIHSIHLQLMCTPVYRILHLRALRHKD